MGVTTVNGKIKKEDLGVTLPHEHLFINSMYEFKSPKETVAEKLSNQKLTIQNLYLAINNPWYIKDNLLLDNEKLAASELVKFKEVGGSTIIEVSSIGCGRSPEAIRNVSNITGVNIIMGCGYYLEETLPHWIFKKSKSELVKEIINEIQYGIKGTNIKPGIIGEIGIGNSIGIWEKKSLEIAVKVQKETGLAISIHIQAVPTILNFNGELLGIEVLDFIEKAGANLNKVVIGHTDAKVEIRYIKKIINYGAYAELDHFSKDLYFENNDFIMDRDMDRVIAIKELIDCGLVRKILISQDTVFKTDLTSYGGQGYGHILNNIVPLMLKKGIKREDIDTIIVKNPAELLNIDEKYL